jgi:DNA-binding IclR family transcriptional regulator
VRYDRAATLLSMPAETSQTLDRGLRVLAMLADSPHGLTVTEIAGTVAVNRTVVYRLVTTLEQHNLARRDGAGRVHVGLGVLALSRGLQPVLREAAGPVLRALAEELGATAHLTLADGGEALAIAVVEPSWTDFHVAYRVGARHALDQGAAGRAILLGREIVAEAGVRDRFVQTAGELQPGARGLAAPVLGVDGLEASVGIVTLGDLDAETAGPRVAAAAAEVAHRLS